jgi:alanine-glyoxylate transaminase / (R)-3-amino-2-methylpropionate-pyruvate transaminase
MMSDLERRFHDAMLQAHRQAKEDADYQSPRLNEMLNNLGGMETARRVLSAPDVSESFSKLWEKGRLDLTIEAVVLRPEWQELFDDELKKIAHDRLAEYHYFGRPEKTHVNDDDDVEEEEEVQTKPKRKKRRSNEIPSFAYTPKPYAGPTREEVLAMRKEYLTPALVTYYREPLMIVEGKMQYLFDEKGRRYLDAFAGIVSVSVGHCHPKVLDAVREQNERLQHATTIYLHPNIAQFAKKLASTFPKNSKLGVSYFVNSGSEANELAVLMARAFTNNYDVIALRNAYHGGSQVAMGLTAHSTWKFNVPHGFGVHHAVLPDCFRGPYDYDDDKAGEKYAADVLDVIRHCTSGKVAAFIAEPWQGVGGVVEMPPDYLKHVYKFVREAGGLCISDEVQTGFGRTGDHFWGFENHGVVPDIVTMAKGIGNGCPLAACVTRAEVAQKLAERVHFNTFGGNPVSCAQGLATLNVLLEENFQQHARDMGTRLLDGLDTLQEAHPLIGDVRGKGLMIGVELVANRKTNEPATKQTADVLERAKNLGVLLGKGGYFGNVIRITPPMCITATDVDFLLQVLDMTIGEVERAKD